MRIYCDKCNAAISSASMIESERNKVKRKYLECKKCKAEYDIIYIDEDIQKLIDKGVRGTDKIRINNLQPYLKKIYFSDR